MKQPLNVTDQLMNSGYISIGKWYSYTVPNQELI